MAATLSSSDASATAGEAGSFGGGENVESSHLFTDPREQRISDAHAQTQANAQDPERQQKISSASVLSTTQHSPLIQSHSYSQDGEVVKQPVMSVAPQPFLTINPTSIYIEAFPGQEAFGDLEITNATSRWAIFKIKTSAPDRYALRPAQDILGPQSRQVIKIVMTKLVPQNEIPINQGSSHFRDKFLLQSVQIDSPESILNGNVRKWWKDIEAIHKPRIGQYAYVEQRIRCKVLFSDKRAAQKSSSSVPDQPSTQRESSMLGATRSGKTTSTIAQGDKGAADIDTLHTASSIHRDAGSDSRAAALDQTNHSNDALDAFLHQQQELDQKRNRYTTVNEADSQTFDRLEKERAKKDYQDLLDFSVKLTTQIEKLKSEQILWKEKYDKQRDQMLQFQTKYEQLRMHHSTCSKTLSPTNDMTSASASLSPPYTSAALSSDGFLVPNRSNNSFNLSLFQLILISIIAFLAGRIMMS